MLNASGQKGEHKEAELMRLQRANKALREKLEKNEEIATSEEEAIATAVGTALEEDGEKEQNYARKFRS